MRHRRTLADAARPLRLTAAGADATDDDRPNWEREGRDWPHRATSRFVEAAGLRWHVQVQGTGPVALLVHGTGAATHSWRDLTPLLASHFTVVAADLPGHGFTSPPSRQGLSLPGMAASLAGLVDALGMPPALAVGHSAGAAVLIRMCLDRRIEPACLVSLNGALLPFEGLPGQLFSPVARLLARSSLIPQFFAWRAGNRRMVERLLDDTGSRLEPWGVELYHRLARCPGHVGAALGMMAEWDLHGFARELPTLTTPLVLVAGGNDRAIRPSEAYAVRARLPNAKVVRLPGLGHLAHEERPAQVAVLIIDEARAAGLLPP